MGYVGTKDEGKGMADSSLVFGINWTIILAVAYFAVLSSILSRFWIAPDLLFFCR